MPQFLLQVALVGLGAGASSALLFASALAGSALSIPLFCLAPLPILIAAIGWSHWAALAAAAIAAIALALGFGSYVDFLVSVGLPAWWLGYLALLARPAGPAGEFEWYPPGRLVLWAALLAALTTFAGLAQYGADVATVRQTLQNVIEHILRAQMHIPNGEPLTLPGVDDPHRLIDLLVIVLPLVAAALTTLTELFNLWLAARIVRISGRLRRPWPDLADLRFPPATPVALAVAIGASFLPGILGLAAALPAASLLMAYAALGFAVLHGVTRDLQSRAIVLVGIYAVVVVLVWPLLLVTLLGLIDTAFDLRARVAAMRGPPAPLA